MLSPLLETSLLFFVVVCQVPAGGRSCNTHHPKKNGSTHGSLLQSWQFPVYGESAYVLEGRHGGLVGTKALGGASGPCLLYGYDGRFVLGFLSSFASQWML